MARTKRNPDGCIARMGRFLLAIVFIIVLLWIAKWTGQMP